MRHRPLDRCSLALAAFAVAIAPAWLWANAAVAELEAGYELAQVRTTIPVSVSRTEDDLGRHLQLELGKSVFLQPNFKVFRVSVGGPEIVDVVVLSPREIQLIPKKIGGTNVILWEAKGKPSAILEVDVGSNFSAVERKLRSVLGTQDIHVSSAGEAVVVQGTVSNPVEVDRAMAVARAFFPKAGERGVVNALDVGGNQQVAIEVTIAEMQRSLARDFSVNLDAIIRTGGQLLSLNTFIGGTTGFDSIASDSLLGTVAKTLDLSGDLNLAGTFINPGEVAVSGFLDLAITDGLARVLARPTLMARSGQRASFLAGGEVPIPIAQGGAFGSITVEFKQFGVGVEFAPTVLGEERIFLEIAPEVSEPDFSVGTNVGGLIVPGFVTRRASTAVELGDGQSFAIAGLLSDNVNEVIEKYPLIGDIPILGALFRSSRYQRNETELVMIVTPRLVKPLPDERPPLPGDAFVAPSDFEFFLLGALEAQSKMRFPSDESAGLIGPAGHRIFGSIEGDAR